MTGPAGHHNAASSYHGGAIGIAVGRYQKPTIVFRFLTSGNLELGLEATDSSAETMYGDCERECSNGENHMLDDISSISQDLLSHLLHFYVDVLDVEESMYEAYEKNEGINHAFHAQLQHENNHDTSTFLTLPEIISTRKRKR